MMGEGRGVTCIYLLLSSVILLQVQEVKDVWMPWLQVHCKCSGTLEVRV